MERSYSYADLLLFCYSFSFPCETEGRLSALERARGEFDNDSRPEVFFHSVVVTMDTWFVLCLIAASQVHSAEENEI